MSQTDLQKAQVMDAVGCLEDARGWASALVAREKERGETDPLAAVARKTRHRETRREVVPRSKIWSLLYRPPKSVPAEVYLMLGNLYEAECARQAARFAEERTRTEAKTWIGRALVRAADRVGGESDGGLTS